MSDFGRRGFLKLLGLGSLGAAVTAAMPAMPPAFWQSPEPVIGLPEFVEPLFVHHQPISLEWMTRAVVKEMGQRLNGQQFLVHPAENSMLGSSVRLAERAGIMSSTRIREVVLDQQFACQFDSNSLYATREQRMSPDQFRAWQLDPVAAALAGRVKEKGWECFGALPLHKFVDEAAVVRAPSGIAVRGVRAYDIQVDQYRYQFDILGG